MIAIQSKSSLVSFLAATVGLTVFLFFVFFNSCDDTLSIKIDAEMIVKKSKSLVSQPTMDTAEPKIWSQHRLKPLGTVFTFHLEITLQSLSYCSVYWSIILVS